MYLGFERHFWLDSRTARTTRPLYRSPSTTLFTITVTISRSCSLALLRLLVSHSGRSLDYPLHLILRLWTFPDSSLTFSPFRGEVSRLPSSLQRLRASVSYTLSPPSRSIIFTTGAHREGLIQGFQEKSSADRTTPRIRKSSSAVPNLTDQPRRLTSLSASRIC